MQLKQKKKQFLKLYQFSRFLRHVSVIYVDYPGPTSLTQIYGTFNRAMLRMIPALRSYAQPLTDAMVEFYSMSQVWLVYLLKSLCHFFILLILFVCLLACLFVHLLVYSSVCSFVCLFASFSLAPTISLLTTVHVGTFFVAMISNNNHIIIQILLLETSKHTKLSII